jgi:hypothetical protein
MWFQLYVLKDRGFMKNALERAQAAGVSTLVFTVDMPVPGARYRDAHSGMSGPNAAMRRYLQAVTHPHWALDVGLMGRPHTLGNISTYKGQNVSLEDYMGYLGANFDPSISWSDLEWIRDFWKGPMLIKGILDPEDARMPCASAPTASSSPTMAAASSTACSRRHAPCRPLPMPSRARSRSWPTRACATAWTSCACWPWARTAP